MAHSYHHAVSSARKYGSPRDEETAANNTHCAYAEGCDPNVGEFDDWYGTSRDLVGGDDFVETLPIDDAEAFLASEHPLPPAQATVTPAETELL
jgi:hypothetical protein